jgi:hypothetical protein
MAGLQNRKTALGLKKEVTENTPVAPTSANDYTTLQDGFDVSPSFEELTSSELQSSIGTAKSVLGNENPTLSLSHYIRHSGVEGQGPDYEDLLESAFGAKVINSTEYDTVSASTTLLVKVDTGEGVNFQRGQALLVKNSLGYEIRNVLSVSGDDLTLGHALNNAPASGVNLGKAVQFKPADENHPTLTLWIYRANGGAIEMMSGSRVTEFSLSAESGQYVNGSFNLAGVAYYFNPIEITATNKYIDFNDGAVKVAQVAEKFYKDPKELASALETAMNAVSTGITVSYSNSTGKFTIAKASGTLSLLWSTGTNTANSIGATLGYVVASDDTGSLSYLADNAQDWSTPQTPSYDSAQPLVAKNNEVMMGSNTDTACFGASSVNISLSNVKTDIPDLCEESGRSGSIISAREVTAEVTALLSKHDVDKFYRFRTGQSTAFAYNFGEKSGGNWVAGKSCNVFIPTATISSFKVTDQDGLCVLEMTLKAFVESGLGEFYLNFV